MIETTELTLSHADLGTLDEYGAMTLFGNALLHGITAGTGISASQIEDDAGNILYPAHYFSHLRVPLRYPLETFRVWDTVSVGASLRTFGTFYDCTYVLGAPGEVLASPSEWNLNALPTMRGGVLFINERDREEPTPGIPRADMVAKMPKLSAPPPSAARLRKVKSEGGGRLGEFVGKLRSGDPIDYTLVTGRDVRPGHGVMYATFVRIMDYAERVLLTERVRPTFPARVVDQLRVLERETFYLGNCQPGQTLSIRLAGTVEPFQMESVPATLDPPPIAILKFGLELHERETKRAIMTSRVTKALVLSSSDASLRQEGLQMVERHT
jgi:probable biosynthetic protein (TIGR04098 family)